MKILREKAPALWAIFFKSYTLLELERPYGCSDCPFAGEHNAWGERPNPADPDEGYYDCRLLNKEKIWGKKPECSGANWRDRGAQEIEAIADFMIQQEIIEEKASTLLNEFAKALQDESNGDLTLNQIKEKLLAGVEPRVLSAFNVKLRPMGGI